MRITDKRINQLIQKFRKNVEKMGIDDIFEYIEYPGGIAWITEKQLADKYQSAAAYVNKVMEHGNTAGQINIPLFKIVLVKERVVKLNDREFLFLLAHEYSHILIGAKRKHGEVEEWMCDTLAEYFFGYRRRKGTTLGYLLDKEAFSKIHGEKKTKKIFGKT